MNLEEIKLRANGHWVEILSSLGIDNAILDRKHHPCPSCGGKDRFRFTDHKGRGSFICNNCGKGDGFELLMKCYRCDFVTALDMVKGYFGCGGFQSAPAPIITKIITAKEPDAEAENRRRKSLEFVWSSANPITLSDPVDLYLRSRNISLANFPSELRCHPACEYWADENTMLGYFPALIASVRALNGELVNLRRIYLTSNGSKAPVPEVKKLMKTVRDGALKGACTRLAEPDRLLCISEGIENGLALMSALDVPTWAAGSTWSMETIDIPDSVQEVWIAADNDESGAGIKSARTLFDRLQKLGIEAKISMPDIKGQDWADVLAGTANTPADSNISVTANA